jgi:hypothetical protein
MRNTLVRPLAGFDWLSTTGLFGFTPLFGLAKQLVFQYVFLAMFMDLSQQTMAIGTIMIVVVHLLCCYAIALVKVDSPFNKNGGEQDRPAILLFCANLVACVLTAIIMAVAAGWLSGTSTAAPIVSATQHFKVFGTTLVGSWFAGASLLLAYLPYCGFGPILPLKERLTAYGIALSLLAVAATLGYWGGTAASLAIVTVVVSAAAGAAIDVVAVVQTLDKLQAKF